MVYPGNWTIKQIMIFSRSHKSRNNKYLKKQLQERMALLVAHWPADPAIPVKTSGRENLF